MALLNSIASWIMVKRMHQIDLFRKYPHQVQEETFVKLMEAGVVTEFGKQYNFSEVRHIGDLQMRLPVQSYEEMQPWIDRLRRGEQNLLWPSEVKWFAKSSGTTDAKSKYIPVTRESLEDCHYKGGKDMVSIYCSNYPDHQLFTGRNLALGGSHTTDFFGDYESYHGDVSAIIIQNLPMWADFFRLPNLSIALMSDWEEKLEQMARSTMNENVVSLAGVPSWMMVLMRRILDVTGKNNIGEVWNGLEVYFHGGVNFTPYKEQFNELFGKEIRYLELYNASEGFFGIQDATASNDLLLMLDYGIYYEFIEQPYWNTSNPPTVTLDQVEIGKKYSVVISTTGGLWRYQIGDTIQFTSTNPYKFCIVGRTKHFINVFGEELMIENAERALQVACEKTGACVCEYTAAPVFMDAKTNKGAHEWVIEFDREPVDIDWFTELFDNALKSVNSDYEAKRFNNYILHPPVIRVVPHGTFYKWMKSRNKLGGQHKVPRLSNERTHIESVLHFDKNSSGNVA
jgi:GH3 auxin-responsive promoter